MITSIKIFKIFEAKRKSEEYEVEIKGYININPNEITKEEIYSQIRALKGVVMLNSFTHNAFKNDKTETLKLNIRINIDHFYGIDIPLLKYISNQIKKIQHVISVSLKYGKFE